MLRDMDPLKIDYQGEPNWLPSFHGEFAVIVEKVRKGDGLEEYGTACSLGFGRLREGYLRPIR